MWSGEENCIFVLRFGMVVVVFKMFVDVNSGFMLYGLRIVVLGLNLFVLFILIRSYF